MVCKEEIVSWFKDSVSYKRVDLLCTLLNMCLPFELRFLGTYLEELGKRDFSELRDSEIRANNTSEVADVQCVSDKHTRRKLSLYLSLLHSTNYGCSDILYNALANFDFVEVQSVLNNSGMPTNDDENALDELLLLYTMALNHPSFTYEQKSVFGSILMQLQHESKIQYPQKPAVVCLKAGMPPLYMPCTAPSDATSGVNQHFSATLKPIIQPPTGVSKTGGTAKALPIQEMATPTYFQLAPIPSVEGQSQGSVLFCTLPTSGLTQAVISPNPLSVSEYPQSSFMLPSVGEVPGTTNLGPDSSVTSCFSSAANINYSSPYRSPNASPYGSPVASRSGSPNWTSPGQASGATHKSDTQGPVRHGSSSSSSSCSGGSTVGYRSNRTSRTKQKGQSSAVQENINIAVFDQQRRPASEEQLQCMVSNMKIANETCNNMEARQESRQQIREKKRQWIISDKAASPDSVSAGSSQSESPSPPRTPLQEDTWDSCKEDSAKWNKVQGIVQRRVLGNCTETTTCQGPPLRSLNGIDSAVSNIPQDMKPYVLGRVPAPNISQARPLAVFPVQCIQALHSSSGAIFQAQPVYLSGTALFSTVMPQHSSSPAIFTPITPDGITSSPPELLHEVSPSQTSPPPFPMQEQFATSQASSPPPQLIHFPPYPPSVVGNKFTCYNCGGANHRGSDCHEPSIEEVMWGGMSSN